MIFSGLVPSKLKDFSNKFNGSICAYRVFYIPIFRRIEGGGVESVPPPRSLRSRQQRGPERVNTLRVGGEGQERRPAASAVFFM